MPNWVQNLMIVEKKHIGKILDNEGNVNFNIICPMPLSLDIQSIYDPEAAMYYYLTIHAQKTLNNISFNKSDEIITTLINNQVDSFFDISHFLNRGKTRLPYIVEHFPDTNLDELYKMGKILTSNYLNYGSPTWYEWCNRNWGTKWNACYSHFLGENENYAYISFCTAWSPPDKYFNKLCNSGIPFYVKWIEEQGFIGEYNSDGRNLISTDLGIVYESYEDDITYPIIMIPEKYTGI